MKSFARAVASAIVQPTNVIVNGTNMFHSTIATFSSRIAEAEASLLRAISLAWPASSSWMRRDVVKVGKVNTHTKGLLARLMLR